MDTKYENEEFTTLTYRKVKLMDNLHSMDDRFIIFKGKIILAKYYKKIKNKKVFYCLDPKTNDTYIKANAEKSYKLSIKETNSVINFFNKYVSKT